MNELYEMALADNGRDVLFTQTSTIHGHGLFTRAYIPTGTILCRRLGLRKPLSLRDKRAIVGVDGLDPHAPEDNIFENINHSCKPNAWLTDMGCLVSNVVLHGEIEITIDYATILPGSPWQATCSCGDVNCRRVIKSA